MLAQKGTKPSIIRHLPHHLRTLVGKGPRDLGILDGVPIIGLLACTLCHAILVENSLWVREEWGEGC